MSQAPSTPQVTLHPDALANTPLVEASLNSDLILPIIEETLDVTKEQILTGTVRLTKSISERPESVNELVSSEYVNVERVPRNELVTDIPSIRTEGNVTIFPVVEEVVVVTKQLRLKEEIRVTTIQALSEYHEEVMVRSEQLTVERLPVTTSDLNQPEH